MLVIRPIASGDFQALLRCAKESGAGFTSLPDDEKYLQRKLEASLKGFSTGDPFGQKHADALYFFVAEDLQTREVVGTCALDASVGLHTPFYHYHLSTVVHHSPKLDIYNPVQILTLNNDYTSKTELCSLFLQQSSRQGNNGRLLSKSRFLFLANFPHLFSKTVFAEMRGVVDAQGYSPFWTWLEQHFFNLDFNTVDYLTGIGNKRFISDLMPKYPIYVNLLSDAAKQVIGKTHSDTTPALRMLYEEGFVHRDYIDIFDGGPTVECEVNQIHSIQTSFAATVQIGTCDASRAVLVSNQKFADYRATFGVIGVSEDREKVTLSPELAHILCVNANETVRVMEMV